MAKPTCGKYNTKYYNLDVIISVGYRVKSQRGTQFRIWATQVLKQYMLNGYAINEARIKALENKIDNLSKDLRKEFKSDIAELRNVLIEIANRPITINNQISLINDRLEDKIVTLLDEIIQQIKSDKDLKDHLEEIKQDIKSYPRDKVAKEKITKFLTDIGDKNSDLSKTINGVGVTKKIITELIKLGEKLKDMIW